MWVGGLLYNVNAITWCGTYSLVHWSHKSTAFHTLNALSSEVSQTGRQRSLLNLTRRYRRRPTDAGREFEGREWHNKLVTGNRSALMPGEYTYPRSIVAITITASAATPSRRQLASLTNAHEPGDGKSTWEACGNVCAHLQSPLFSQLKLTERQNKVYAR